MSDDRAIFSFTSIVMFDRERFIDDLKHLAELEVPWKHQGVNPEVGMDCVGSLKYCYEKQGLRLPEELENEFEAYHRPPNGKRMLETMRKFFIEIAQDEMMPADIYQIYIRKNPCHMAVKVKDDLVAEAYESMDGSVSKFLVRPFDPRYRIAACFRIPDGI